MEGEDTVNCYVPHNFSLEAKGLRVEKTPDGLFCNVSVSNEGTAPNSAVVLDLNKYGNSDKVFAKIQVPEIQPGETAELRSPINISADDLGSMEAVIFTLNAPEEVNLSVTHKSSGISSVIKVTVSGKLPGSTTESDNKRVGSSPKKENLIQRPHIRRLRIRTKTVHSRKRSFPFPI